MHSYRTAPRRWRRYPEVVVALDHRQVWGALDVSSGTTSLNTLRPGRAPPVRPARRTVALTSSSIPRRPASVDTNNSPGLATRCSSSKVTAPSWRYPGIVEACLAR